ncbi:HD domain-containing protein [Streptomyces sp. RS10V-4]|uniref:HD domain-containing protein n=1 Tax=Streptomyces rhizoryzae TaxID=2932493 RepID=UPI002005332E|nr:HD domain-containing protein [Streptomyces rhizoryzae]MCK7622813.1 HD domain-containing protein [Streptomyces rhizoryzae]
MESGSDNGARTVPDCGGAAARAVPTNVVGMPGVFTDPLWRIPVRLAPVEVALLRSAPLRRLHFIAHGGASALSTIQSYSRLEHSLGVFALVAHFCPADEPLRVAALLHDIGHLPLSHTCEGVSGLDHHVLGRRLLDTDPIRALLLRHSVAAETVAAVLDGRSPSPLTGRPGLLNLDHLDSYVRSGRAAGCLDADPAALLRGLTLRDSAVSADRATAAALVRLVGAEARLHTSWDNVGPVSVVRRLARRLLDGSGPTAERFARMTDPQLWSAFETCAATRAESIRVRYEPHRLAVVPADRPADRDADRASGWDFSLRKIYRSAPLVDGAPVAAAAPELAAELVALGSLPTAFRVRWT